MEARGQGSALKPGWEPIILARKPFAGTLEDCFIQHGTGALNIDSCRIESVETWHRNPGDNPKPWSGGTYAQDEWTKANMHGGKNREGSDLGRWPANVLLDEEAAAALDEQTGELTSGANPERRGTDKFRGIYSALAGQQECEAARGADIGGASRFFYVAKPSREERDFGCEGLTARQRDESRKEGNPGGDNPRNRGLQARGNFHPTVKPVELMRWLVRLVTPAGGTVLDPFMGSGTTGMACRYELREFVGIEREADYVQIAERRIAACAPLFANEVA